MLPYIQGQFIISASIKSGKSNGLEQLTGFKVGMFHLQGPFSENEGDHQSFHHSEGLAVPGTGVAIQRPPVEFPDLLLKLLGLSVFVCMLVE